MFWNIYKKYILRSLRSKEIVIWTLVFPVLLSTLFYFALGSLEEGDMLDAIDIAVVENAEYREDAYIQAMMDALSEGEEPFLEITAVQTEEAADALLKDEKVEGFVTMESGDPVLSVKDTGIEQTVLKNVFDRYIQTKDSITAMIKYNPGAAQELAKLGAQAWEEAGAETDIEQITFSGRKPSAVVNFYYALLAMVCLYGGFHGVLIIESLQANLSPQGARNAVSPGNRGQLFGGFYLAALTTQFVCMTVVLCYIRFVLGISFGGQFFYALLTCVAGCLTGISLGCLIALPARWKGNMKIGMVVCVSMFCCFFAGLMIGGINYVVDKNAPLLSMINPAARIADAFYCLYYYDNYTRFFQNIGILLVMTAVMLGVSLLYTRRKQYESI